MNQPSLLDLFNAESAEKFPADQNDAGAKNFSPLRAPNPFRKREGFCTACGGEKSVRLFWSWRNDFIGCWDCFVKNG